MLQGGGLVARRVRQLCSGLRFSNGVALSPDGRRLYHNETFVGLWAYDIMPDGKQLLVVVPDRTDPRSREVDLVLNWFEELKRRVPRM